MDHHFKVLLIEDNPGDARLIREMLDDIKTVSFESEWVSSLAAGAKRLSETHFDALLLDLGLPDAVGLETLEQILAQCSEVPVMVMTGLADGASGVEAVQKGAQDYLVKGTVNSELLSRSIIYSIERKRLMMELHNLSLRDELTGLYNRRGFFAVADQQCKLAKRSERGLLLIMSDLDGMKDINDTYGHIEGDTALKNIGTVLRATFRDSDIIGRIGGDEFAVLVVGDDKVDAKIISARIRRNLDAFNTKKTSPYTLSVSTGIASIGPQSICSIENMLAKADKAMYKQKRSKRKTIKPLNQ